MENYHGIYKITNTQNNKVHIGYSLNIPSCWVEHLKQLVNKRHKNKELQNDFNKQNIDDFDFEVVHNLTEDEVAEHDTPYKRTMYLVVLCSIYVERFKSISKGYNFDNTLVEVIKGNKWVLNEKLDRNYLRKYVKKNRERLKALATGKTPEVSRVDKSESDTNSVNSKPKTQQPKIQQRKNKTNATGIHSVQGLWKRVIQPQSDISLKELRGKLCDMNIIEFKNYSYHTTKYGRTVGVVVDGKENTNGNGFRFNSVVLTDVGIDAILDELNLKLTD